MRETRGWRVACEGPGEQHVHSVYSTMTVSAGCLGHANCALAFPLSLRVKMSHIGKKVQGLEGWGLVRLYSSLCIQ